MKLPSDMFHKFSAFLLFCVLMATAAYAQNQNITLHFADGTSLTGEIVQVNESGILLREPDGKNPPRVPWTKLSQADLKELQQNPKAEKFVEPFIEVTQAEKLKKTEVEIKPFPKMQRPTGVSLIGALCGSVTGIFVLLILYAANLYAAYEIAIFRAQPPALVCGVAAVAPLIGPVIFISMPTRLREKQADWQTAEEVAPLSEADAAIAAEQQAVAAEQQATTHTAAQPAGPPPPKVFARGQFTFNRRFFETQLPAFFAMARPEAERDTVLTFKTARGAFQVQRISRISASDITLQVHKGHAFEDHLIPFVEIQEVQLQRQHA
jgi:hypothetical protein